MTDSQSHASNVADSLLQIELELRTLGAWQEQPLPPEAFESTQPFCLDTMSFPQWLQFVFVARMKVLLEAGQPLPSVSGIAPMAEEYFRARSESGARLIQALAHMDGLLSGE
ncbi:MAG: YqcC family protein [Marinobacter sp.]|uniref:YqcC family protein n=1 Tax=unclassified Marinobacter TaxID=83889 RepID=UPI00273C6DFC|nr:MULTISPECIES: YqcC family protein [unclassified Marinobacter]MDP4548791.1 YqcC family protein [Marinobacter sp. MDS2]